MHSLFWKMFLSFWVALILFAGATLFTTSHYLEQTQRQNEASSPRERLMQSVAEAQRIAERDGVDGLKQWLREFDRREPLPLFLVDSDGADLLGRPLPASVNERLAREERIPRPGRATPWPRLVIRLPDQREYRLLADFHGVTLGRVLARPRVLALPLILATLVGGFVCFLLARSLTAPLARLRRATEIYAAGDLNARVAPSLGGRKDEIADLARAFDHMAQRLQEIMSSQRRLVGDVSHELRSPLARLQVALGLARQRTEGRGAAELDRIELEAERLSDLIGQLLSLAKLESGVTAVATQPLDLTEMLEGVVSDADFEARAHNRHVTLTSSEPAIIQGDARLLQSAFDNIVRNALRYTADGTSVTLSLARQHTPTEHWCITIRDHGPGVPEAMLPLLFEPFVRVGDARDRASGGYGLGLAIAQRAIRLHAGEVSARNEPGGGLAVSVRLPITNPRG
jgi:two-component system, OmpR family, sensor histidine kinase CpxA